MSRIISAGFILGVLTTAAFAQTDSTKKAVEAKKPRPAKPRFKITISKETTYLTEPLTKDGFVDYERALNDQTSKGVTPENNAAVLLWKAFGPRKIHRNYRKRFFSMMGIEPFPNEGDYFVLLEDYAKRLTEDSIPKPGTPEFEEWKRNLTKQIRTLHRRPWAEKEFPIIARWLDSQEKPIALIVEASHRPRMLAPLISSVEDTQPRSLMAAYLHTSLLAREAVDALSARAMKQLREGKIGEAQLDILACHRLARLIGQQSTLIEGLVATYVERSAFRGVAMIAAHGNLTAKDAAHFQSDLEKLAPMPHMVDKINNEERYAVLELMSLTIHYGPEILSDLGIDNSFKIRGKLRNFWFIRLKRT